MARATRSFPVSPTLRQPAEDLGPRAVRTVTRILDATRSIFLTHGYAGTTVDEITRVAGVSRPSFYTYFPSKRDALLALGTRSAQAGQVIIDRAKQMTRPVNKAQIESFVQDCFEVLDEQASFSFAWTQAAHQDEEIRKAGMRRHVQMCSALARVLGDLRDEPFEEPVAQGLLFFSQLERSWSYCQLYADDNLLAAVQRSVTDNLVVLLRSAPRGRRATTTRPRGRLAPVRR